MLVPLAALFVVALLAGLLILTAWTAYTALRSSVPAAGDQRLPARRRAEVAAAIAQARWVPGHDEVDRTTRVLMRRTYPGLDGHPAVLEERVLETFPSDDPAWESRFTEAMSAARFRCSYLNTEEAQP